MAGALWKSSTGLASSATLMRLITIFFTLLCTAELCNYSCIFVCRLKCPRITPRQLSSNVNNGPSPGTNQQKDAFQLAQCSLSSMIGYVYLIVRLLIKFKVFRDIHSELEAGLSLQASQLGEVARLVKCVKMKNWCYEKSDKKWQWNWNILRYYFDGAGKAVRPVIAVCLGKAALLTTSLENHAKVKKRA